MINETVIVTRPDCSCYNEIGRVVRLYGIFNGKEFYEVDIEGDSVYLKKSDFYLVKDMFYRQIDNRMVLISKEEDQLIDSIANRMNV